MKNNKRFIANIIEMAIGVVLCVISSMGMLDEYWSGMGIALIFVSALMLIRHVRYKTNDAYREEVDIRTSDERNRYLAMKAWSWAGYFFVLISAVASIALRIAGLNDYSQITAFSVCALMVLYWISYVILHRKY